MDNDYPAWLKALQKLANANEEMIEKAESLESDEMLSVYPQLLDCINKLTMLKRDLEVRVAHAMKEDMMPVSFLDESEKVTLKKAVSKSRTNWDNDSLVTDVKRKIRTDMGDKFPDGQKVRFDEIEQFITRAFDKLGEVFRLSGSSVRVGVLKEWDIDPDEYCESRGYRYSVQVVK
jgi:hypothetical protein